MLYDNCSSQSQAFTRLAVITKGSTLADLKGHVFSLRSGRASKTEQAKTEDIFKFFIALKNLLRDYEVIAGWYALAIVLSATDLLVNSLVSIAFPWDNFSGGMTDVALQISAILMLSFFAEYMRGAVRLLKSKHSFNFLSLLYEQWLDL